MTRVSKGTIVTFENLGCPRKNKYNKIVTCMECGKKFKVNNFNRKLCDICRRRR